MSLFSHSFFFATSLSVLLSTVEAMPIYSAKERERAVVVIPDDASPVTLHAGRELVVHLNLATGGSFLLKRERELLPKEGPYRIYVGATNAAAAKGVKAGELEKNHYITYPASDALYLVGNDARGGDVPVDDTVAMGSLLAVYDWLDRALGVRWIWPGETGRVVPRHSEINTAEGEAVRGAPRFTYANPRFMTGHYQPGRPSRYGRTQSLEDRSLEIGSEWFRRQKMVKGAGAERFYGHAFSNYWERFGKKHPEWFALGPNGKRGPVDERITLTQLCVSNPELHQQIIRDWLETRTPERPWINGCENDRRAIDPFCHCADCKAWDVPAALVSVPQNPWHIDSRKPELVDPYEKISMSDRYSRFLLALLEEGKKHDPSAKVVGYAYSFYSDAPVATKLNSDVVIIYVPPFTYPLDKDKESIARDLWDRWKATGVGMIYRPNDFLMGYPAPYSYATQFGRDFKHYLDGDVIATDFDSTVGAWGAQGANLYMMGRLHARPELSPEAVMEEYLSAFGAAKGTIRDYLTYLESVTARADFAFQAKVNGGWAVMMRAAHQIFDSTVFAEGRRLLKQASEEVSKSPEEAARVEYLRVWLEHSALCVEAIEVYRSMGSTATAEQRRHFNAVYEKLMKFREDHDAALVGANWWLIKRWEPWRNWKL